MILSSRIAIALLVAAALVSSTARSAGRAVVFVADKTTLSDLTTYGGPNIRRIMNEGSVGLMNNRGARGRSGATCALTINSLARAAGDPAACMMMSGDEWMAERGATAGQVFSRRTRLASDFAQVLNVALPRADAAAQGTPAEGKIGLLGDVIRGEDVLCAAIGCSDCPGEAASNETVRWAAAIAMCGAGTVDAGDVSRRTLMPDPGAPFGVRTDPQRVVAWLDALLSDERVALVVIDFGDTYRASVHARYAFADVAESQKAETHAAADDLLGQILDRLDPAGDTLFLVSLSPPADARMELVPIVAWGSGFKAGGLLWSPGTRQEGIVTAPDLGATLASLITGSVPAEAVGFAIESRHGAPSPGAPRANPHLTRLFAINSVGPLIDGWVRSTMLGLLLVVWTLGFLFHALAAAAKKVSAPLVSTGRAFVVWASLFAAALFWVSGILNLVADKIGSGAVYVSLLWAWTVGLATLLTIVFLRVWPKTPLRIFSLVAGAWVLALVAEIVFRGSPFDSGTVLGYSPYFGGRFYGIGNVVMALLAGGALSHLAVQEKSRFETVRPGRFLVGWWIVFFAIVLFVIAAPQLGSNIGGGIGAVVGFAAAVWVYSGRKLRAKHFWLAVAVLVVCLAGLATIELTGTEPSRGHLGRFILDVKESGIGPAVDLLETKARLWGRAFKHATWDIAFVGVLGSCALVWALRRDRFRSILSGLPAMNAALVGGVLGASVAFFVNDSGPVVPVLIAASVFGPFLCHSLPLADQGLVTSEPVR